MDGGEGPRIKRHKETQDTSRAMCFLGSVAAVGDATATGRSATETDLATKTQGLEEGTVAERRTESLDVKEGGGRVVRGLR